MVLMSIDNFLLELTITIWLPNSGFLLPLFFLHLLVGINLLEAAFSSPYLFVYLYQYGLMDSYYIQWVVIHYYYDLF